MHCQTLLYFIVPMDFWGVHLKMCQKSLFFVWNMNVCFPLRVKEVNNKRGNSLFFINMNANIFIKSHIAS